MKNVSYFLSSFGAALLCATAPALASGPVRDVTHEIPVINTAETRGFVKIDDVCQYKNADWSQVVGVAKGVSLEEAYLIAQSKPEIHYFFYVKSKNLTLETEAGDFRSFHRGDAVFFAGEPTWGGSAGHADGYVKCKS